MARAQGLTSSRQRGISGGAYLSQGVWGIVVIILIVAVLQVRGWFAGFENPALDVWLRFLLSPHISSHVVIIEITDKDYEQLFKAQSPLSPEVIRQLITAIASGRPQVIGVDLDTSTEKEEYRPLQQLELPPSESSAPIPIIWARDARPINGDLFLPAHVLGAKEPMHNPLTGIALLPQDSDGIIRRYRRVFRVLRTDSSTSMVECMNSLPLVITNVARHIEAERCDENREEEDRLLNFLGDRYHIPHITASDVHQLYTSKDYQSEGWQKQGPLQGKIVLLGGTFHHARDQYVTPLGPMNGVELMAQAIETEWTGGGIRFINELLMVLMDIFAALTLVSLYYLLPLDKAFWWSLVAIPLVALVGSLVAFKAFGYWMNYVPLLIGLLIHQLYHTNKAYHEIGQHS
jgi:CHASE2 domain-containing sensor protein